jgi:hypothetical protein
MPNPRPSTLGRPKGPNRAAGEARLFYARIEELGLTLAEARARLQRAGIDTPSYRTLQDWRRGLHKPRFVPFRQWTNVLGDEAAPSEAPATRPELGRPGR